jgi:hypothetical protein
MVFQPYQGSVLPLIRILDRDGAPVPDSEKNEEEIYVEKSTRKKGH